jgi:L-aminopeptidase/D-esterase-like protein
VNQTITAVAGVEVGHWSDAAAATGCTVVAFPEPNRAGVEVRGGAPGSRETALLEHGMRVEGIQAILLTGGSAFGLAAADGVVAALEEDGRGHPTPVGRVPIVPAAVVFDLQPGEGRVRPGPQHGRLAYAARSALPVEPGLVGAGTGTTVAKWRGFEHMRPGGLASAVRMVGESSVGALVVLNAVGDVFTVDGESLTGGDPEPGPPAVLPEPMTNTTLVVIATDAVLDRAGLSRLAVRSNDALAACLRPAHTRYDGDVVFAVSCGEQIADHDALGEAAFGATAAAIELAVRASAV